MRGVLAFLAFLLATAQPGARAQAPPSPVTWTETRLTDDPAEQVVAVVADGRVAWLDARSDGTSDVRVRDLATGEERAITADPVGQYGVDLDGDYVVYGAEKTGDPSDLTDIFAFNLLTGVETLLSTEPGAQVQGDPAVAGDWVVWGDGSPLWEIKGRRLSGGPIMTFALGAATYLRPRISGDQVAFEGLGGSWDVFGYDISTTASYHVATGPEHEREPDIDGTRIVYLRFASQDLNGNADVVLYDHATGVTTPLTTTPAIRRRPRISGHTVVWYEGPSGDWDVRGYDLVTGTELPLALGPSSALLPDVDGHEVVFADDRNGHWDIYRLTLNRAPEASAGPDQTVEATSPQGAVVTLDGSASSDNDSDPLTFTWTGPFGTLSGAVVSAPLPLGTSEITLSVADGHGGTASDTLTVTVAAVASCPEVYVETFDPHGAHADPAGWVDFAPGRHGVVEADGFRTSRYFGRRLVYEARRGCRASELRTPEALAWRDYEWSGWYRPPRGRERGDGFFVYSDLVARRFYLVGYQPHGHRHEGYRLVKSDGSPLEGRVRSGFVPRGGAWHRFRIQVVNEPDATRVRARFWKAGRPEPTDWTIDARDSVDPLRGGAIGLLALARGARYDSFRVLALSGPASGISGDRDGDGICDVDDLRPDEPGSPARPFRGGGPYPAERLQRDPDHGDGDAEGGDETSHPPSPFRCRWGLLPCSRGHAPGAGPVPGSRSSAVGRRVLRGLLPLRKRGS